MWKSCWVQPLHKERAIGVVRCKNEEMLLQPLQWCCVDCVIHHERDVREELKYICVARLSNNKRECDAWSLLLVAAAVRSFAHMPLVISDHSNTRQCRMKEILNIFQKVSVFGLDDFIKFEIAKNSEGLWMARSEMTRHSFLVLYPKITWTLA